MFLVVSRFLPCPSAAGGWGAFQIYYSDSSLRHMGSEEVVFLAPVLSVTRAPGFGLAFGVATLLIGSCSVLPNESDRLRIQRVEEAVLPMARVALEAEQTETAKRLYRRLLEVDPDSVSARMGLGDLAVAGRNTAEAARWYAAAVAHARRADERHPALLAHGRAALAMGELEAARKSFSRLTSEREPAPTLSVAWGLNGLGLVALLEGDIRGAIKFMERAVLLAPEEEMLADNLSRALDLSADMAPEGASADRARDMAAAAAASLPGVRGLAPSDEPAAVEKDVVEDRTPEEPGLEAYARPDVDAREERPADAAPGADRRRIDRSELRPYAIKVGGEYYVRIGAHATGAEARDVAAELRRVTTEPIDVVEFGMGDGLDAVKLYRVLVGPITSSAGLVELVAVLDEMGYGAARLPPSVAAQSAPPAVPAPGLSSDQRNAGPELVEVLLDPAGEEPAAAERARATPTPAPEEEVGLAPLVAGEASSAEDSDSAPAVGEEPVGMQPAPPTPPSELEEVGLAPLVAGEASSPEDSDPAPAVGEEPAAVERVPATPPPEPEEIGLAPLVASEAPSPEDSDPAPAIGEEPAAVERKRATSTSEPEEEEGPDPAAVGGATSPEESDPEPADGDADARNESGRRQDVPQFLQVGAYTVRAAAEALAAEVGGIARAPVRVIEAELANGETMYRVQVGPVRSRRMMMELSEMLIAGGYGTVRVLPESATADSALRDVLPVPPPPSDASERRVKAFIVHENGSRFLQMGAYAVRATADTLASQLRLVAYEPVFAAEALNDDGDALYRVRIGPIESDASLAALLRALRSNYGNGWELPSMDADSTRAAFVVREDSERFLQMGAYAVRSAADALASELRGQVDGEIRVTEVSRGGGDSIYRVRVGPMASDDSLLALVESLESLGYVVD